MTTITDHIEYVEQHPFEKAAALALADRLQEESNGSRRDALKFVAAVRKPGRDADYLARAARVMRAKSLARSELGALIQDVAGVTSYGRTAIFLVKGFSPPSWSHDVGDTLYGYDIEAVVFVGARWVIHHYRLCKKVVFQHRPISFRGRHN